MKRRDFLVGASLASRLRAQGGVLRHIMCSGHSLMAGVGAALSTSQPFANKVLSGGTALSDLVASSVEDPPCGMANQLRSMAGSGYDLVVTRNGHGSANYNNLKKGGTQPYYADSMTNANLLAGAASAAGKTASHIAIMGMIGENDLVLFNGDQFALNMRQLQLDYSTDLNSGVILPLFLHQPVSWNDGIHGTTSPVMEADGITPNFALGLWYAMRDNPGSVFLCATTYQYWGLFSDNIHPVNTAYRRIGEQFGKWMYYTVVDGQTWSGLPPRQFRISGNVITARFWLRTGRALAIDTSIVPDQGTGKGFQVWDSTSGTALTVSSVSVSGDTATITLSATPTAGHLLRLRYAYTATLNAGGGTSGSPAGNLRNDDPIVGQGGGSPLYDWAFTFDEPIPFNWNPPISSSKWVIGI